MAHGRGRYGHRRRGNETTRPSRCNLCAPCGARGRVPEPVVEVLTRYGGRPVRPGGSAQAIYLVKSCGITSLSTDDDVMDAIRNFGPTARDEIKQIAHWVRHATRDVMWAKCYTALSFGLNYLLGKTPTGCDGDRRRGRRLFEDADVGTSDPRPRPRRDSSEKYPRRGRGVAAIRLHGMSTSQPQRRLDPSPPIDPRRSCGVAALARRASTWRRSQVPSRAPTWTRSPTSCSFWS